VGDRSVEAASLGGGVQEGIGSRRGRGVGGGGEITRGGHVWARLDGQALGYEWDGRPVD
jgi:hypothetical protein